MSKRQKIKLLDRVTTIVICVGTASLAVGSFLIFRQSFDAGLICLVMGIVYDIMGIVLYFKTNLEIERRKKAKEAIEMTKRLSA